MLLEGVPGVAKTLLVRTLAASLALDTKRVQFTPDLMPGDVTGSLVYDARTSEFSFRPGPVFTNLLLADEINRTPPKTQASLLEAMEERQVSVDGVPRPLPDPFIVVRHAEPDRVRGHLPAPRGAARPLPAQADAAPARARRGDRGPGAARAGFDPRDLAAAGVRPVAGAAELAAGRAAVRAVTVSPGGPRLRRRRLPGHPPVAVAVARRLAARGDRAARAPRAPGRGCPPATT